MKNRKFPIEWKENIERSGKLFEHEVALLLQDKFGWIIPNYAYTDIEEGKSRELDIFVITAKKLGPERKMHFLFPILLVAIKAISLVCFVRREFMSRYTIGDVHFSGMPKTIYSRGNEFELVEYLNLEKFHHFYKYRYISSQFWTPLEKDKEKKGDYFYNSLILPLIKAVVAEKEDHESGWYFDPEEEQVNLQFYYPIIVVKELWECKLKGSEPQYVKTPKIGFLARYASGKVSGSYHIDVCDKNGLKILLKTMNAEVNRISDFIKKRIKIFENSAFSDAQRRIGEERKV